MKILPWRCHICNEDFDEKHGGICTRCGMPVCFGDSNYGIRGIKDMFKEKGALVCNRCKAET